MSTPLPVTRPVEIDSRDLDAHERAAFVALQQVASELQIIEESRGLRLSGEERFDDASSATETGHRQAIVDFVGDPENLTWFSPITTLPNPASMMRVMREIDGLWVEVLLYQQGLAFLSTGLPYEFATRLTLPWLAAVLTTPPPGLASSDPLDWLGSLSSEM